MTAFLSENKWDRLEARLREFQRAMRNASTPPSHEVSGSELATLLRRQYGTDTGFIETVVGKVVIRRRATDPEKDTRRIVLPQPSEPVAPQMSCNDKLQVAKGVFQGYNFKAGLKTRREARALARRKKRLARKHHIGIKAYTEIRDRFIVAMKGGA